MLEGGFHPNDITPRPPFSVALRPGKAPLLTFDASVATGGERTILGGLKTKNVDVVVTKDGLGPVLAVSCKGMTGAFRNLTNRMEETIGECTNLHITYPAMVFGYMFIIRANRQIEEIAGTLPAEGAEPARQLAANDVAVKVGGEHIESIARFYAALRELTGRRGIRNDVSRYESVALAMVEPEGEASGEVFAAFPKSDSPLHLDRFFQTMYLRYEERFLLGAPDLKAVTRRHEWSPQSPALDASKIDFASYPTLAYEVRMADAGG